MTRIRRVTSAAVMVCVIASQCGTLFASDEQHAGPPPTSASHLTFNGEPLATLGVLDADRPPRRRGPAMLASVDSSVLSQRGFGRGRGRGRNDAATAAIVLGAIGTIAGAAVLVYADRPECNANPNLGGCGYGTKVVGGAVLTAGLVGLMVGALTWR
jgi:hypothetical protein